MEQGKSGLDVQNPDLPFIITVSLQERPGKQERKMNKTTMPESNGWSAQQQECCHLEGRMGNAGLEVGEPCGPEAFTEEERTHQVFSFFFFLIERQVIYNIVFVSGVQHNALFWQITLQLKLLSNIGYIPCPVCYIFVTYLFYTQWFVPLNSFPLFCPHPLLC